MRREHRTVWTYVSTEQVSVGMLGGPRRPLRNRNRRAEGSRLPAMIHHINAEKREIGDGACASPPVLRTARVAVSALAPGPRPLSQLAESQCLGSEYVHCALCTVRCAALRRHTLFFELVVVEWVSP